MAIVGLLVCYYYATLCNIVHKIINICHNKGYTNQETRAKQVTIASYCESTLFHHEHRYNNPAAIQFQARTHQIHLYYTQKMYTRKHRLRRELTAMHFRSDASKGGKSLFKILNISRFRTGQWLITVVRDFKLAYNPRKEKLNGIQCSADSLPPPPFAGLI